MRTKTYVLTVDKHSDQILNQLNKLQEVRNSVKCQGRWGKKNPNYNHRAIPFCPLADAVKWDVYIYER